MPKTLIRVVVIAVALLTIIIPLAGGYAILRSRQAAPAPGASVQVGDPSGGGLQRSVVGAFLTIRDADLRRPAGVDDTPIAFTVNSGETADSIARNLKAAGLIVDADLFKQLVKYQDVAANLQAGDYQLRPTMNMYDVVDALQRSKRREATVTIREGWRLEQIAEILSGDGLSTYDDLIKAMRSSAFGAGILAGKPATATLEGYLFPDTYQFDMNWKAEQIVDRLLGTMDNRFTPAMRQQASALGLSTHQVLTLASLVEREAVQAAERPMIAGVLLNRLQKDMPLQVDATVQYALGYDKEQQRWWPDVTSKQLQTTESPYNTYLYRKLPPGPIASPSLSSIQAVLQPIKSEFLYYVAKGDGGHAFAKTFDEHMDNIKKYQK